jgi:hypothetical protein
MHRVQKSRDSKEVYSLLDCDTSLVIHTVILEECIKQKLKVIHSFKIMVNIHETARYYIHEDRVPAVRT